MTKITIAAKNLTIALTSGTTNIAAESFEVTVDGQKRQSSNMSDLLKALLAGAGLTGGGDSDEVDANDAIAFVAANPHCTIEDVAKHFGMETEAAADMMDDLNSSDRIALSPGLNDDDDATFVSVDYEAPSVEEAASSQVDTASAMPSAPAAEAPALSPDNVLAFLRSDPRYTLRSQGAISKHFHGHAYNEVGDVVGALYIDGKVGTKTRRSDRAPLFYAVDDAPATEPVVEAAVETGEAVTAPEMNVENVRAFISADPRYTRRTLRSIAKHFGVGPAVAAINLGDMVDDDDLDVEHRRRDGEPLYSLA